LALPLGTACSWFSDDPAPAPLSSEQDLRGRHHRSVALPPQCNSAGDCTLEISVPEGHEVSDFAVLASTSVRLGDRADATDGADGSGAIAAVGRIGVFLGQRASSGSVIAAGPVVLDNGARVDGTVTSAADVTLRRGASVTGEIVENQPLVTEQETLLSVRLGGTSFGPVRVHGGPPRRLEPGKYGAVDVRPRGELDLGGGVYVFDSLDIQRAGELKIDNSSAAVEIHVLRGLSCHQDPLLQTPRPNVRLVYWGTVSTTIDCSLDPIGLIAPNASVSVADHMRSGPLVAKHARIGDRAKVSRRTFRRFTTGIDPTAVVDDLRDADARALCRRVFAFGGTEYKQATCNVRARGAALASGSFSEGDLRTTCSADFDACMGQDQCQVLRGLACNAAVGAVEACLDRHIPRVVETFSTLPACSVLSSFQLNALGPLPDLPAECSRLLTTCAGFGR